MVLVSISVIMIFALGYNVNSKLPYVYPNGSGDGSLLPLWLEQWYDANMSMGFAVHSLFL